jgi:FAD synthetase
MTAGDSARDVEVPASPLVSNTPLPFPELCARIHDRIDAFLKEKDVSDRVRSLQEQTQVSLEVIGEALEDYQ